MNVQEKLQEYMEKVWKNEALATEGFAAAFIDATGLDPRDAEMVVQHYTEGDKMGVRIWFREREDGE